MKAKRKEKRTVSCISSPFVLIVEDEWIKIFVTFSMYSFVEMFLIVFSLLKMTLAGEFISWPHSAFVSPR